MNERNSTAKPRLLMLAAHEPSDDPRVDWAATLAARWFDVEVLGLRVGHSARGAGEDHYRVIRVRKPAVPDRDFWVRIIMASIEVIERRRCGGILKWAILAAASIAEPMLRLLALLIETFWSLRPRISVYLVRHLGGLASPSTTGNAPPENSATHPPAPRLIDQIHTLRETLRHVLATGSAFCRAAKKLDTPRIVYAHDLDTLLPAVLIAIRTGARLIYDSHEYWPFSNVHAHRVHEMLFTAFERSLIWRPDLVMTVSEPLAKELARTYARPDIASVPNAEPWVSERTAVRPDEEMERLAAGRVRFLFQGSFAPQRGLEELVNAWARVDHDRAVLFLRGPRNAWRDSIQALAEELGLLGGSVHVLPPVRVEHLVAAAGQADVGVIPYKPDSPGYRFACPNKLSQYMQAGVCILTNEIEYVVDQVRRGDCGRSYRAPEPSTIVSAVNEIARDPELLGRLKRNATAYARDVFNWEIQSAPLQEFLSRAATGMDGK